jgi:hypothetical protein
LKVFALLDQDSHPPDLADRSPAAIFIVMPPRHDAPRQVLGVIGYENHRRPTTQEFLFDPFLREEGGACLSGDTTAEKNVPVGGNSHFSTPLPDVKSKKSLPVAV